MNNVANKLIQSILDSLKLTEEDDFDDDFDDDEPVVRRREPIRSNRTERPETVAVTKEQAAPAPRRFEARTMRSQQAVRSLEEPAETYEQPRKVRPERQPVPMRSAAAGGLELIIRKPSSFDDSQEICDLLKQERAIIVNLENVNPELAQKMMDFISGAIYALDAKIHQISGSIFCISPAKVDISGDYFAMISETTGFKIPDLLNK